MERTALLTRIRSTVLLIFLMSALVSSTFMVHASPYTNIDVGTAYTMITSGAYPNLVVLDVRTKSEYDSGHIYGATLIPVGDLPARIGELASHKNDDIIVYCGSGGRSATASDILDSNGFARVHNVLGGLSAWKTAGYPTWIATVHNVNTTYNYDTIQAAIDSPQTVDGHAILVDEGTYYEHVVVLKTLSLTGEDSRNTVIDGKGTGIAISIRADNVTVENFSIRNGVESGVDLNGGNYAQIQNNKITDNYCGVNVSSSYNMISSNEIASNQYCGVSVNQGKSTVFENNITSNNYGLRIDSPQASNGNLIYHNNLLNNTYQASTGAATILWNAGYPSGGNYWGDYNGTDLYSGTFQTVPGGDGVGDTPYTIDANNTDHYPLIRPWLWGSRYLTIISTEGGTTSPEPGNYAYSTTSYIEVTAIVYSDYTIDHWELDGCNVTGTSLIGIRTDANHTLRAQFTHAEYTLRITFTAGGHTDPAAGTYIFGSTTQASVNASSDPGYYLDRWELDGIYVGVSSPVSFVMDKNHTLNAVFKQLDTGHNIAVKWVTSKTVVGQGFDLSISVIVMNIGSYAESFNATACLNSISITLENATLDSGAFTTLTYAINTLSFSKGNYTIWAYAGPISGETETEDNNFTGRWVVVAMIGDVNADEKVDGKDLGAVAWCFGSYPEAPLLMNWNPNCDIDNDAKVDGKDLGIVAWHFGESTP